MERKLTGRNGFAIGSGIEKILGRKIGNAGVNMERLGSGITLTPSTISFVPGAAGNPVDTGLPLKQ
jgi:hypothetical protein